MSFPKINIALFFLILASVLATIPSSDSQGLPKPLSSEFRPDFQVHVVNNLGRNKILLVHCKSKDNDLGIHNLTVGSEFSWRCKTGPTLPPGSYVSECIWVAKDNGVYMKDLMANRDDFISGWQQGRVID
ncbi:hypothetical protein JCGZ_24961 [Jatropha curcas]|uniref:S-protein homolog n=1 Tax=Jatropha curcas TaxID=180498 RepID=A0A067KXT0_JATCU|nr:S-protein homolog 1 [Jatropha curcas]KDP40962.1 hypothetical protein JCGZ_24961 [Jatropha curcas]